MITAIALENFRNFESFFTELAPVTLITGPNGAGKTSILEAIALFGGHRFTAVLQEMILWDTSYARVELGLQDDTYSMVRMVIQPKTVRVFGDDASITLSDVYARVPSVYFSPRIVSLLEDAPSLRRRFLDQLLMVISPYYREALKMYTQTLRQRNAALSRGNVAQHIIWEAALAEHGAFLTLARNWCVRELSSLFVPEGFLRYQMSPKSGGDLLPTEGTLSENISSTKDTLQSFLQDKWESLREKEIQVGFTLMGPQRDDWGVMRYKKDQSDVVSVGSFGSRGEQRMAVITLQRAALSLMAKILPVKPLWILDDVFSELDALNHSEISAIVDTYQTFVSAANDEYAGVRALLQRPDVHHINLKNGDV